MHSISIIDIRTTKTNKEKHILIQCSEGYASKEISIVAVGNLHLFDVTKRLVEFK